MPANDNFASATAISGTSGSITGDNIGATTETGEPGHYNYNPGPDYPRPRGIVGPYATVWYKWTAPAFSSPDKKEFQFTTKDTSGNNVTNFPTTLRVFTGSVVSSLTAVTMIEDQCSGVGYDYGASAVFMATSGSDYFIQIDSRNDGETGDFILSWGEYVNLRLSPCSGCNDFNFNESAATCFGSVEVTDVSAAGDFSFGSQPCGYYAARYCTGSFRYTSATPPFTPYWAGTNWPTGQKMRATYYSGGVKKYENFTCAEQLGRTEAEAERLARCCSTAFFIHEGGDISINFTDSPYTDNALGSPPPKFLLVGVNDMTFLMQYLDNTQGFGMSGSGTSWTINCNIRNTSGFDLPLTVELLSTGGVSSPSSPLSIIATTGATTATGNFTFTADPTAGLCTCTIQLKIGSCVIGTLDYPLYPIFSISITGPNDIEKDCTSFKYWRSTITLVPLWPPSGTVLTFGGATSIGSDPVTGFPANNCITGAVTIVGGSPNLYNYSSCSSVASIALPNHGRQFITFTRLPGAQAVAGSSQSVTFQVTMNYKVTSSVAHALPTFTQTITVPAA